MSIHVALTHVTHYTYDRRVAMSPHIVRLRPAPHCRSNILLPIDEVALGLNLQRVAQDVAAAMRRRAQPHDVRRHRHAAVVCVVGDVGQGDVD